MKEIPFPSFGEEKKWLIPPIVLSALILGSFMLGGFYLAYRYEIEHCGYTTKYFVLGVTTGMWRDCQRN